MQDWSRLVEMLGVHLCGRCIAQHKCDKQVVRPLQNLEAVQHVRGRHALWERLSQAAWLGSAHRCNAIGIELLLGAAAAFEHLQRRHCQLEMHVLGQAQQRLG